MAFGKVFKVGYKCIACKKNFTHKQDNVRSDPDVQLCPKCVELALGSGWAYE
jgi:DNA-directed RNA polymerase subunit RPC12/RpoP